MKSTILQKVKGNQVTLRDMSAGCKVSVLSTLLGKKNIKKCISHIVLIWYVLYGISTKYNMQFVFLTFLMFHEVLVNFCFKS